MTTTLKLTDSVGAWVTEHPATSRVFENYKIDYCCGGKRPLQDICSAGNVDTQALLDELQAVIYRSTANPSDDEEFSTKSMTKMCDSIEAMHHEYLKRELPRLTQIVEKVVSVHGNQHAWLKQLETSFQQLRDELVPHMFKEERILFPAIRTLEQSDVMPKFPFGSVDNPIQMMEHEHDTAGQALREIRAASSEFTLPTGGCNTFRAMLDGLRELEGDLHWHIHKENNVLFPRASQRAAELLQQTADGVTHS